MEWYINHIAIAPDGIVEKLQFICFKLWSPQFKSTDIRPPPQFFYSTPLAMFVFEPLRRHIMLHNFFLASDTYLKEELLINFLLSCWVDMCLALFFSHQLQQLYFPAWVFKLILCWDLKGGQKTDNVDFQLLFLPEVQSKHEPVGTDQHQHLKTHQHQPQYQYRLLNAWLGCWIRRCGVLKWEQWKITLAEKFFLTEVAAFWWKGGGFVSTPIQSLISPYHGFL